MSLRYQRKETLGSQHLGPVNAVAFSPDGMHLASAGEDGRVVIWSVQSRQPLSEAVAASPVLSLAWLQSSQRLLCGCHDGTFISIFLEDDKISFTGFSAHGKPVECLSFCESMGVLASGAHDECKLWVAQSKQPVPGLWDVRRTLPDPPPTASSDQKLVVVTSIQLFMHGKSPRLLVSYMHHGITCWDLDGDSPLWGIALPRCGAAFISPDQSRVVASNLSDEFLIYEVVSGTCIHKLQILDNGWRSVLPVQFIHDGLGLLTGSSVGQVQIWDLVHYEKLQTLLHNDEPVQAISAYYDGSHDIFLIATATSNEGHSDVYMWQTEAVAKLENLSSSDGKPEGQVDQLLVVPAKRNWRQKLVYSGIAVLIGYMLHHFNA